MSKKSAQVATYRSLVEDAFSAALYEEFRTTGESMSLDYAIGAYDGNPAKDFNTKAKELMDKFQATLVHSNDEAGLALYHAYSDVVLYGTATATAAEDAGADESDLAWLLSKRPASEQSDKSLFAVSKEVKKLREPKEEKKPSKKKKNDEE